ncbi:MAG: hypothetical protein HFE49_02845 [Clostridia bacterium]|nr:hypothetical protein [Clostridia bacterium]
MKYTKIAAAALTCALLMSGCGKVDGTKTVMTVGNEQVTAGMYGFYYASYKDALPEEEAKERALTQCEDNQKVIAVAKAMGIEFDEDKKKEIADYKQQVVDSYSGGYEDFLKENNLSDADVDTIISVSFYAEKLQEQLGDKEYTDEDKKAYFRDHYRRAKHILISTKDMQTNKELSKDEQEEAKKKAEDLFEKAKNGENFDTLIMENSQDPGSLANTDGYFFTDNEMVKEFQDGVDSLQNGEFTLVKSDFGYHVIQRLALDETQELFDKGFEEKKSDIENSIENNGFKDRVYELVDQYGIVTEIVDQKAIDTVAKNSK